MLQSPYLTETSPVNTVVLLRLFRSWSQLLLACLDLVVVPALGKLTEVLFAWMVDKIVSIGHFRVVYCLCQNESSCETIHIKLWFANMFIFIQIKLILI